MEKMSALGTNKSPESLKKEIPSWTFRSCCDDSTTGWCNSLPVLSPKQSRENVTIPTKRYGRIARHISKASFNEKTSFPYIPHVLWRHVCCMCVCLQSSCVVLVLNLSILQESDAVLKVDKQPEMTKRHLIAIKSHMFRDWNARTSWFHCKNCHRSFGEDSMVTF